MAKDITSPTKTTVKQTADLVTHIAKSDNHLWQALTSLQKQSNDILGNMALICYGTMSDRISANVNSLGLGALWFVTDFPNAVYQVRTNPATNTLDWYYATGLIWLPPNATINFPLGPNDAGLMVAMHGYIMYWDGIGPQLQCEIYGPCTTGGSGAGSTGSGSPGSSTGSGATIPPVPPNTTVAGPVGNFQVSNVHASSGNVTGTFTWTLPTTNINLYTGVELWIVGGAPVEEIGAAGPTDTSITITIPIPGGLGVNPLTVAAISTDVNVGLTMNPGTLQGQASPTVIWITGGGGGGDSGTLDSFGLVSQVTNADGSVTGTFGFDLTSINSGPASLNFAGIQFWLVNSTGSQPNQVLGADYGDSNAIPTTTTITAPASAVGETWTIAAITVNKAGTLKDLPANYGTANFSSPVVVWTI